MQKENIQQFINKRKHLIWWVQDTDNLSDEIIIETVFNYGDWDDVQELIEIIGIKNVSEIFEKQLQQKRVNYSNRTKKYFTHYFKEHA